MSPAQAFGLVLRELRLEKGWSQMTLGEKAGGISGNQVGNLEHAKNAPRLDTVFDLAWALEISVPEFFRRVEAMVSAASASRTRR